MRPKVTSALWYLGLAVVSSQARSRLRARLPPLFKPIAWWLALTTLSSLARLCHYLRECTVYRRRRQGGQRPTAVITGAASGIGLATAQRLHRAGFIVGLLDVNTEALEQAARLIRSSDTTTEGDESTRVHLAACDVRDPDQCQAALRMLVGRAGGKLDVLFNSAGILRVGEFASLPIREQLQQVQVNLNGVCIATRAALPALQATAGSVIVTMASQSSFYGIPTHAVYSATKHAVRALTEALSCELESSGVRVVDINVGYVQTPMLGDDHRVPKRSFVLRDVKSWRSPADVAATVERVVTDPDPGRLHYNVDWGTWFFDIFTKMDNLFSFGLSPTAMRLLVMPSDE